MIDAPPSYETINNYPSLLQQSYTSQQIQGQQIQQIQQGGQGQGGQGQGQGGQGGISSRINLSSSSSSNYRNNNSSYNNSLTITTNITRPKMNEVRLYQDTNERRRNEELGDLYAIIKATEALEAAFSRDAITSSEYSEACTRLISQFKSTESALITGGMITSAEIFMKEYEIDCPRAYDRLIKSGVPATVLHVSHDDRADSVIVAETVQNFITSMDALKLDQRAVDSVQPLISDLMASLTKVQGLSPDFEGLVKLRLWLQKLNQMRAVEEISEVEARQLIFDLEGSYSAFHRFLSTGRK